MDPGHLAVPEVFCGLKPRGRVALADRAGGGASTEVLLPAGWILFCVDLLLGEGDRGSAFLFA